MDRREEYWKIAEIEQRFNTTQSGVRALASSWLLAAFGAIAFLVRSEDNVTWLFHKPMLVVVVAAMASVGLFTLWIIDQIVFHRLLNAVFIVGLKMEHDDPTLPPVRAMMMHSAEGVGMSRWLSLFYFVPMISFLGISIILTLLLVFSADMAVPTKETVTPLIQDPTIPMIVLTLLQAAFMAVMWRRREDINLAQRAEMFGDPSFTELFEGYRFQAKNVIKKYSALSGDKNTATDENEGQTS